jgi:hypothetical protein
MEQVKGHRGFVLKLAERAMWPYQKDMDLRINLPFDVKVS